MLHGYLKSTLINILEKLDTGRNIKGYTEEDLHASFCKRCLRWLPTVFANNPSYQAYVTEGNLVTLSLRFCSRDSPLRLPI